MKTEVGFGAWRKSTLERASGCIVMSIRYREEPPSLLIGGEIVQPYVSNNSSDFGHSLQRFE